MRRRESRYVMNSSNAGARDENRTIDQGAAVGQIRPEQFLSMRLVSNTTSSPWTKTLDRLYCAFGRGRRYGRNFSAFATPSRDHSPTQAFASPVLLGLLHLFVNGKDLLGPLRRAHDGAVGRARRFIPGQ